MFLPECACFFCFFGNARRRLGRSRAGRQGGEKKRFAVRPPATPCFPESSSRARGLPELGGGPCLVAPLGRPDAERGSARGMRARFARPPRGAPPAGRVSAFDSLDRGARLFGGIRRRGASRYFESAAKDQRSAALRRKRCFAFSRAMRAAPHSRRAFCSVDDNATKLNRFCHSDHACRLGRRRCLPELPCRAPRRPRPPPRLSGRRRRRPRHARHPSPRRGGLAARRREQGPAPAREAGRAPARLVAERPREAEVRGQRVRGGRSEKGGRALPRARPGCPFADQPGAKPLAR